MTPPRRAATAVAAVVLVLALAACGSTTSTTTKPPASSPAPATGNAVTIKNFMFTPMSLTVKAGTTVTWTNDDLTPHTVAFKDKAIPISPELSAAGGPRSWSHTFTTPGTYPYICSLHTYMTATINVTA